MFLAEFTFLLTLLFFAHKNDYKYYQYVKIKRELMNRGEKIKYQDTDSNIT